MEGSHPARQTFQAIRIEVNEELNVLNEAIPIMCRLLKKGGRLCIITFHSLEDRIVKKMLLKNYIRIVFVHQIFQYALAIRKGKLK